MHAIHIKIESMNIIQNCHRSHTKWQICLTPVANLYDIHTFDFTVYAGGPMVSAVMSMV